MLGTLNWVARHAKLWLVAGLAAGLLLPGVADQIRPWIGSLVALLLAITSARVGHRAVAGQRRDLGLVLPRIFWMQTALPLLAVCIVSLLGVPHSPLALAVCLMLAAPSLTGAPNFAIMMGHDPAPSMRVLVLSTALFPLTALPVLILLDPSQHGAAQAMSLALGLLGAILASVSIGFAVRSFGPDLSTARAQGALDGSAALVLAIVVVGLMSEIGPLLRTAPGSLAAWLGAALLINLTLAIGTLFLSRWRRAKMTLATSIYAGNRNIALFLIVLPPDVSAPLMIFIGCYQIPMYLTPLILGRFRIDDERGTSS